jgi:hypothetical protein
METSQPMYKAYNISENCNMTYDDRINLYDGGNTHKRTNSMNITGFTNYNHSGGISKNDGLRHKHNSIALRIAEAKLIKGTLQLNNDKPNGGSWKKPSLDLAL